MDKDISKGYGLYKLCAKFLEDLELAGIPAPDTADVEKGCQILPISLHWWDTPKWTAVCITLYEDDYFIISGYNKKTKDMFTKSVFYKVGTRITEKEFKILENIVK